jgi:hypothetical protein
MTPEAASAPQTDSQPRFSVKLNPPRRNLGLKNDLVCALGEFLGTAFFLFLALGGSNFARKNSCL